MNLQAFFDSRKADRANGRQDRQINPTLDIPGLSEDTISQCLVTAEIALRRLNIEEAKAAIDRAFKTLEPEEPVTKDSPLVDLGLPVLMVNALEHECCFTVGDLCQKSYTDLRRIENFGDTRINQIRVALSRYGFDLRNGCLMPTMRVTA